ncbi:MAG: polyprenyl synthetase family protein [Paracoccaceae bacterium]
MFEARRNEYARLTQACLDEAMAPMGDGIVAQGMRYASAGGKRIRGFLAMESAALFGIEPVQSVWAAAAVEAMHAYSLVHDDMPCMDDDDLRRGLPTVHVKWGEAAAVLVGDGLQALSFELLTREDLCADASVRIALVATMARAAGAQGMVLGQAQDIAAEEAKTPLTLEEITELQANKTGALIRWSAAAGALIAGADPAPLRAFAAQLGLAFQIADDILDVEGDAALTGKRVGKDADAGKATFVSLLGLDAARTRAQELVEGACDALAPYGDKAQALRQAARFVISRDT